MDATRREMLAEYRMSPAEVAEAIFGVAANERDRRPTPGEWSAREVVHHLADTEILAGGRLRLILSRNAAPVARFDQNVLADVASHPARSMEKSMAMLEAHIDATADLLESLDEDAWNRYGVQEDGARYPIDGWLKRRIDHAREHADQIRRSAAGKS